MNQEPLYRTDTASLICSTPPGSPARLLHRFDRTMELQCRAHDTRPRWSSSSSILGRVVANNALAGAFDPPPEAAMANPRNGDISHPCDELDGVGFWADDMLDDIKGESISMEEELLRMIYEAVTYCSHHGGQESSYTTRDRFLAPGDSVRRTARLADLFREIAGYQQVLQRGGLVLDGAPEDSSVGSSSGGTYYRDDSDSDTGSEVDTMTSSDSD